MLTKIDVTCTACTNNTERESSIKLNRMIDSLVFHCIAESDTYLACMRYYYCTEQLYYATSTHCQLGMPRHRNFVACHGGLCHNIMKVSQLKLLLMKLGLGDIENFLRRLLWSLLSRLLQISQY